MLPELSVAVAASRPELVGEVLVYRNGVAFDEAPSLIEAIVIDVQRLESSSVPNPAKPTPDTTVFSSERTESGSRLAVPSVAATSAR